MHDPEAQADTDQLTVTRSIETTAPLDVVWDTLTNPRWIADWFGTAADFPDGMAAGSSGTFAHQGETFPIDIITFEAPRRWEFRWGNLGEDSPGPQATDVRFDLAELEGGTRLRVVEIGWMRVDSDRRAEGMQENARGWNHVLDSLRADLAS